METMTTARRYTIGYLSERFQASVPVLRAALVSIGIRPAQWQDDVDLYPAAAVEKLENHFFRKRTTKMLSTSNSEIESLQRENKRLKTRAQDLEAGTRYWRRVESLVAGGMARAQAAAQAARENPEARKSYLKLTNRQSVHASIEGKQRIVRR
jgi:hypothetical protein